MCLIHLQPTVCITEYNSVKTLYSETILVLGVITHNDSTNTFHQKKLNVIP